MIVTVTPNPSLDLLFSADRLVWNDANRLPMPRRRAGGQGINVIRAARALRPGADAHAIAPLGGPVGEELRAMLEAESTPLTAVPIAGDTRVFVGVREAETGRSLLLNPRGPVITGPESEALLDAVDSVVSTAEAGPGEAGQGRGGDSENGDGPGARVGTWVAGCGSLLPGLAPDYYARVGRRARSRGARFVPDCDGEALSAAVPEADLLVPNDMEASRLVGRSVSDPGTAAGAGRELRGRGPKRVVITLGADGAVAVDGVGAWWARPVPPGAAAQRLSDGSAVGAGDAFLAALLQALDDGATTETALADAVAAGTATLLSRGTDLVTAADFAKTRTWIETRGLA